MSLTIQEALHELNNPISKKLNEGFSSILGFSASREVSDPDDLLDLFNLNLRQVAGTNFYFSSFGDQGDSLEIIVDFLSNDEIEVTKIQQGVDKETSNYSMEDAERILFGQIVTNDVDWDEGVLEEMGSPLMITHSPDANTRPIIADPEGV